MGFAPAKISRPYTAWRRRRFLEVAGGSCIFTPSQRFPFNEELPDVVKS